MESVNYNSKRYSEGLCGLQLLCALAGMFVSVNISIQSSLALDRYEGEDSGQARKKCPKILQKIAHHMHID